MLSENAVLNDRDSERWENFLQELIEHEYDHVHIVKKHLHDDVVIDELYDIRELTLNYDPRFDVESAIEATVKSETTKIGHKLIKKINQENNEYDRITQHGHARR